MLALCVVAFSSCKKNHVNPQVTTNISFKFNGASKTATTVFATYYTGLNSLQVIGQISPTEQIALEIDTVKTKIFDLGNSGVIASYSPDNTFKNTYFGTNGTITITTFTNNAVSGTFNFTGQDSSKVVGTVTQGTFSAPLIKL